MRSPRSLRLGETVLRLEGETKKRARRSGPDAQSYRDCYFLSSRQRRPPSPSMPTPISVMLAGSGVVVVIWRLSMPMVAGQSINSSFVTPLGKYQVPLCPRNCGATSVPVDPLAGDFV